LLNETWLATKDNYYIKGFDVIHRKEGTTAILIINKLKCEEGTTLYDCDGHIKLCIIILLLVKGKLLLANGYMSPDKSIASN
jgi:hypothetical protein